MKSHLTAIIGGIGAGKSVVSSILRKMSYDVYDSDSRAKAIMDNDSDLRLSIANAISPTVLNHDTSLNRPALAAIVFNNAQALATLNKLVHGAVRNDVQLWCESNPGKHLFIETAILYQSHLDKMVDDVWEVTAPDNIRIARVMARNNISAEQVKQRIEAQQFVPETQHPHIYQIVNDDIHAISPQIATLLNK